MVARRALVLVNGQPQQQQVGDSIVSIGDTVTSGTAGSVIYMGAAGIFAQDNANLFWDATNHRLGIGTTAPETPLHVKGLVKFEPFAGSYASTGTNSNKVSLILNDGVSDTIRFASDASTDSFINAGNFIIGGTGATGKFHVATGTITALLPTFKGSATWNNSGVVFSDDLNNVTNTASAAGSKILDRQVGGVSAFNVGVDTSVVVCGQSRGQFLQVHSITELTTIAAAAFTDSTASIPANSTVVGFGCIVQTVVPTASTFSATGATSGTALSSATTVSTALNTIDNKGKAYENGAAQKIRFTPNLTPAAATGKIRWTLFYLVLSGPTS